MQSLILKSSEPSTDSYESVRNRKIAEASRPDSITRKEAEKLCREIIKENKVSEPSFNLFKESVDLLMEEINGAEYEEVE